MADGVITAPVYRLVVQESGDMKMKIAEETGISHESPQVLVMRNGAVVWHASHEEIEAERIAAAVGA